MGIKYKDGWDSLDEARLTCIDAYWRDEVRPEIEKAMKKFPQFNSAHEGFAVLLEEVDEAWDEVKANDTQKSKDEMVQVAAMAMRYLVDV